MPRRTFSRVKGMHQTLENGNLLITETEAGRVFEVDELGDVVWEYINRYDENESGELMAAARYPEGYFTVSDWTCG